MRYLLFALTVPLLAANYEQEIAKFRADREKSLIREDGWTTVVGLSWLKEGDNAVGSDPHAAVSLPASAPFAVGTITLKAAHIQFHPAPGVKLAAQELKEDANPLSLGTVKLYLIRRGDRFAIRVKDSNAETRRDFTHLSWYPVDPAWRIVAKFTSWDKPHKISFDTIIEGLKEEDESPGYVSFSKDGHEYRLEPTLEDKELFFVFRDQTAGKDTYGAGRFLDAAMPVDGTVILDFNKAYNPPCVFTAYATCPLPPPANRLAIPVLAGELMYKGHH